MRRTALPHHALLAAGPAALALGYGVAGAAERLATCFTKTWMRRATAGALLVAVWAASPLVGARAMTANLRAWIGGEDPVTYMGRFVRRETGFDAAVMLDAAAWIEGNTRPGAALAVLGHEPGLFYFSERSAACGLTNTLPVVSLRARGFDRDWARCVTLSRPDMIAVVREPRFWTAGYEVRGPTRTAPDPELADVLDERYGLTITLGELELYLRDDLIPRHVPLATRPMAADAGSMTQLE
ncbi:MAG: hypothetical protein M5R36_15830 [Deltaproteobacteria bacterium]|nr:hypothetical protein [Deltaproteobacteria bacterium]